MKEFSYEEPKQEHRSPDSLIAAIDRIEKLEQANAELKTLLKLSRESVWRDRGLDDGHLLKRIDEVLNEG